MRASGGKSYVGSLLGALVCAAFGAGCSADEPAAVGSADAGQSDASADEDAKTSPTVIDFSDPSAIEVGACGSYLADEFPYRRATELPNDPSKYPVIIRLPRLSGADPACEELCGTDPTPTAFGVAVQIAEYGTALQDAGLAIRISAPAPWLVVSGGCGEACPWPCLGGYQEFGQPRAELTKSAGIGFGFATGDPSAPSVDALVETLPMP